MGVISTRLAKLEGVAGSRSCAECGQPSNVTHEASYIDSEEALQAVYESGPEFCPECGRQQYILGRVVFEGDEEGEGAE